MGRPDPPAMALRLELAADLSMVPGVATTLRQFLAAQGCAESEWRDCELALVEACNNAIQHATGQAARPIQVEAGCDREVIELRVIDHGTAFAWPAQARLPSLESERGRGLYLIQRLMDQAQYRPGPQGNLLILRKNRAAKRA